jgi:hypothetical protein
MIFSDPTLRGALDEWAKDSDDREKACAHNLLFDERLSGARGAFFEAMAMHSPRSAEELRRSAIDYYKEQVRGSRTVPHTFLNLNAAAGIKTLARDLKLIRIESLLEPLEKTGKTLDDLIKAKTKTDKFSHALLDTFVDDWNTRTDVLRNPCSFAANKNQCLAEIASPDWPNQLRDKLGLEHYDGARTGPIPVALMEYEVGDILDQASSTPGLAYPFCIPTALDGKPNSQFFPTPRCASRTPGPLDFGCPMALFVILSENELIAEVVHPRLTYKRDNLLKVGLISAGLPGVDFKKVRNTHLWALQIEAERDDYGAEL